MPPRRRKRQRNDDRGGGGAAVAGGGGGGDGDGDGDGDGEGGVEDEVMRMRDAIIQRYEGMDEPAVLQEMETMAETWAADVVDGVTPGQILDMSLRNFGIEEPLDEQVVQNLGLRCVEMETAAVSLYYKLRALNLFPKSEAGAVRFERMEKIMDRIYHCERALLSSVLACLPRSATAAGVNDALLDARLNAWGLKFRWRMTMDGEQLTDAQELLLYMLDVSERHGYRRFGSDIFEPIFVDSHNTRSFQRKYSIQEFVYDRQFTGKDFNYTIWNKLTTASNNAGTVIRWLEQADDSQLPKLEKDRHVSSWRNGLYLADTDEFVPYSQAAQRVPADRVSSKFFDQEFRVAGYDDWRAIPTPELDSVFEYQDMARDVIEWGYVLFGRMLYDLNDSLDGWQGIPFLYGAAGSGKSLLVGLIQHLYDPCDIGTITNTFEKTFGLTSVYDKLVWVAPEVRNNLNLDQGVFQSMVTGETVTIARKNKDPFDVPWCVPGIMASNIAPDYKDAMGSLARRYVILRFLKTVRNADMAKAEKIMQEFDHVVRKINCAYRDYAARLGNKNLWSDGVLPEYFWEQRRNMSANVNCIEAFMMFGDVVIADGKFCPLEDFKLAVKNYERISGHKSQTLTPDSIKSAIAAWNCTIEHATVRTWHGMSKLRSWVVGCDLGDLGDGPGLL